MDTCRLRMRRRLRRDRSVRPKVPVPRRRRLFPRYSLGRKVLGRARLWLLWSLAMWVPTRPVGLVSTFYRYFTRITITPRLPRRLRLLLVARALRHGRRLANIIKSIGPFRRLRRRRVLWRLRGLVVWCLLCRRSGITSLVRVGLSRLVSRRWYRLSWRLSASWVRTLLIPWFVVLLLNRRRVCRSLPAWYLALLVVVRRRSCLSRLLR